MRVKDLMIPGTREWDVDLVKRLLHDRDVDTVVSQPISGGTFDDNLIWHFSKNGVYSVKSAYHLACSLTVNATLSSEGNWQTIWKLKVPSKVKIFLWRAARDNLPNKTNLWTRRVNVDGVCGVCRRSVETLWHIFVTCTFASECWRELGLEMLWSSTERSFPLFKDGLFHILSKADNDTPSIIGMVLWQIWKDRNDAIWNEIFPVPARSCTKATDYRDQWLATQRLVQVPEVARSANSRNKCVGWHDLEFGWVKCNVDAAFFKERNCMGFGLCMRDEKGRFLAAKSMLKPGIYRVEEGEILGIQEALSWLFERGITKCVVESDSKIACDEIHSKHDNLSELGSLAHGCRVSMLNFVDARVSNIGRDLNKVAHCLAKRAVDFASPFVWEEPPSFVEGLLFSVCTC